jgi:plasmid stabilization system protein ParE
MLKGRLGEMAWLSGQGDWWPASKISFAGRSRNELRPGFRSLATSTHVVFYRVVDDVPEIVRVLYGRQDIEE